MLKVEVTELSARLNFDRQNEFTVTDGLCAWDSATIGRIWNGNGGSARRMLDDGTGLRLA